MNDTTISAPEIRKALAGYIVKNDPTQQALSAFLQTDTPAFESVVEADEAIVAYLNTHSTPVFGKGARFFLPISKKFGEAGVGEALLYSDGDREGYPINGKYYNKVLGLKSKIEAGEPVSSEEQALWEKISAQTGGTGIIKDMEPSAARRLLEDIADVLKLPKGNITDRGVKFRNGVDGGIEQAVRGNGQEVIIIGGDVTPEKARLLQDMLNQLTGGTGDPEKLTFTAIQNIVAYAVNDLGLHDLWDGEIADVLKAVAVDGHVVASSGGIKQYGGYFVHKPKPGKEVAAIHMNGGAIFFGDAVEMQDYLKAPGFFVTIGTKGQYRGVAEEAFCRDYIDSTNTACNAGMLFSVGTSTQEVVPPAKAPMGGKESHLAIAAPETGGLRDKKGTPRFFLIIGNFFVRNKSPGKENIPHTQGKAPGAHSSQHPPETAPSSLLLPSPTPDQNQQTGRKIPGR